MKYKKLLLLIPLFTLAACGTNEEPSSSLVASSSSQATSSESSSVSSASSDNSISTSTPTSSGTTNTDTQPDEGGTSTVTPTEDSGTNANTPTDNTSLDRARRTAIATNINSISSLTMTLDYMIKGRYLANNSYPLPDFDYDYSIKNITKYESEKKISQETSGHSKATYSTDEFIAKSPAVSTRDEVYAMVTASPVGHYEFSADKSTFWAETSGLISKSFLGYDDIVKQYYVFLSSFDENGDPRYVHNEYVYDEDTNGGTTEFDQYKTLILKIVEGGQYNEANLSFTVYPNQETNAFVRQLFDTQFEAYDELDPAKIFTSFTLTVENNQIKQLEMGCGDDFVKVLSQIPDSIATFDQTTSQISYVMTFSNFDDTIIADFPDNTPSCDNHEHPELIITDEYHRLACNECHMYLSDKEPHSIAQGDNKFCTECGHIIGLGDWVYDSKYLIEENYSDSGYDLYLLSYKVGEDGLRYNPSLWSLNDENHHDSIKAFLDLCSDGEGNKYYYNSEYRIVCKVVESSHYVKEHNCNKVFAKTYSFYRNIDVVNGYDHGLEFEWAVDTTPLVEYVAALEPDLEDTVYVIGEGHEITTSPREEIYKPCIHSYTDVCSRCGQDVSARYVSEHTFDSYQVLTEDERQEFFSGNSEMPGTLYCKAHCSSCNQYVPVVVDFTRVFDHSVNEARINAVEWTDDYQYINGEYNVLIPHILDEYDDCIVCAYTDTHRPNDPRGYEALRGIGYEVFIGNRYYEMSSQTADDGRKETYSLKDFAFLAGDEVRLYKDGDLIEFWTESNRMQGIYPNYDQQPNGSQFNVVTINKKAVGDIYLHLNTDDSYGLWITPNQYDTVPDTGMAIVVNGRYYSLNNDGPWSTDNSYTQYSNSTGVALNKDDIISFYDGDQYVSWTNMNIDEWSQGSLTQDTEGIKVGVDGTYDIYIKMKTGYDNIYLGIHS